MLQERVVGRQRQVGTFLAPRRRAISCLMNAHGPVSVATAAKIALGAALFAAATGLAFAAWLDHGAGIFMALVETGLAWCF